MSLRDVLFQPGLNRLAVLLFLFAAFAVAAAAMPGVRAALRRAAKIRRGARDRPFILAPQGTFAAHQG